MNRLRLLSTIALLCITMPFVRAQTALATWNMNGVTLGGVNPMTPTTSNSNVTVVGLTRGNGITAPTPSPASNAWGAMGFADTVQVLSQNAATSAALQNYITFSITPNTGFGMSLSSIPAYNVRRTSAGPANMLWQYSLDGTNFTDIGTSFISGGNTNSNGNDKPVINLSTIADLQGIPTGTTVTFRILLWTSTGDGGTWYFNGGGTVVANRTLSVMGTTTLSVPLPLELISFNGKQQQNSNHLEWVTAQEKNVSFFELEKGMDGRNFNKIATINAKGNDNNVNNQYTYEDEAVTATAYYRLRMVDRDGKATQSDVVALRRDGANTAIRVYPNPSENMLFIEGLNNHSSYRILDVMGKEVIAAATVAGENNIVTVNVEALPHGDYFLQISGDNNNETIRFVKK